MENKQRVFTAPQAYILIDNKVAGYIRNITWTETYQRQEIRGLGNLTPQEVPVTSESNTFSLDNFFIDFQLDYVKALLNRTGGAQALLNTFVHGELPTAIAVYQKIGEVNPQTKLVTNVNKTGKEQVVLRDCFVDSQNWSLAEGGISSHTVSGRYLTPVASNP